MQSNENRTAGNQLDIDAPAIFNTAALGKKKAIDDLKSDVRETDGSRPAAHPDDGPGWLRVLLTVLEIVTVLLWTFTVLSRFSLPLVLISGGSTLLCVGLILLKKWLANRRKTT